MKTPSEMGIIQIDITNACVHSCSNCTRFCGHHKKPFFMDFKTFQRAVDSLKGFKGTVGIMGGEPAIHPEFDRFLDYLSQTEEENFIKKENDFIYPQNNYMAAVHNQEGKLIVEKDCGIGMTVYGYGLWSAMPKNFLKHYEKIHDVFKYMAVNDHTNPMFHQPALISRKDLQISDEKWFELREKCWVNQLWSAAITPKGAFFCEVAAALDMLFDGPGGWPIEPGWWKRGRKDIEDQLHWCELCGLALETFTRDANDEIDDISPEIYRKLEKMGDPKLKTTHVNCLKIENGVISEESKASGQLGEGGLHYTDSYAERFNARKTTLLPEGFEGLAVLSASCQEEEAIQCINKNFSHLDKLTVLCYNGEIMDSLFCEFGVRKEVILLDGRERTFGKAFYDCLKEMDWKKYLVVFSQNMVLDDNFSSILKKTVINPGTLHYIDFSSNRIGERKYVAELAEKEGGFAALLNKAAVSLKNFGEDGILNLTSFESLKKVWNPKKIVEFSSEMDFIVPDNQFSDKLRYAIYGIAGHAEYTFNEMKRAGAILSCAVDSDSSKWGTKFHDLTIQSPEYLHQHRDMFDKIIIGSWIHYTEVKQILNDMGFGDNMLVSV